MIVSNSPPLTLSLSCFVNLFCFYHRINGISYSMVFHIFHRYFTSYQCLATDLSTIVFSIQKIAVKPSFRPLFVQISMKRGPSFDFRKINGCSQLEESINNTSSRIHNYLSPQKVQFSSNKILPSQTPGLQG